MRDIDLICFQLTYSRCLFPFITDLYSISYLCGVGSSKLIVHKYLENQQVRAGACSNFLVLLFTKDTIDVIYTFAQLYNLVGSYALQNLP